MLYGMKIKHRGNLILTYKLWQVIVFCVCVSSISHLGLLIFLFS